MDRIIDPVKIILQDDELLLEVKVKSQLLITPETAEGTAFDYLVVVSKGKNVLDYEVGDIIVDLEQRGVYGFKVQGRGYIKMGKHSVKLAVKPDNFDNKEKSKLLN